MKLILFVSAIAVLLAVPALAQDGKNGVSFHLDSTSGELTFSGSEAQNFANVLGDLAPWAAVKTNQGLKNKFTAGARGLACIGDLEFFTRADCQSGFTTMPDSIKDATDENRQALSKRFVGRLRNLLSLMPNEDGSGALKDLLIRNRSEGGSGLFISRIDCEKNFLLNESRCVLQSDALKKQSK